MRKRRIEAKAGKGRESVYEIGANLYKEIDQQTDRVSEWVSEKRRIDAKEGEWREFKNVIVRNVYKEIDRETNRQS